MSFQCDRCRREFNFEDIAYLGPANRESESCNPFEPFECICRECNERAESPGKGYSAVEGSTEPGEVRFEPHGDPGGFLGSIG